MSFFDRLFGRRPTYAERQEQRRADMTAASVAAAMASVSVDAIFSDHVRRTQEVRRQGAAGTYALQQFYAYQRDPEPLDSACRSCGAGEVMEHRGQRLCAYCRMPR